MWKTLPLLAWLFCGCQTTPATNPADEKLAQTYCGNCHAFPEPSYLDKATWQKTVLPQMALRLGMPSGLDNLSEAERAVKAPKPLLSDADWKAIKNYYLTLAPERLSAPERPPAEPLIGLFEPTSLPLQATLMPNITCVRFAPPYLFVGDEANQRLSVLDTRTGKTTAERAAPLAISDIRFEGNKVWLTHVGNTVKPTLKPEGNYEATDIALSSKSTIISKLYRPTEVHRFDLDNDKKVEILSLEFGLNTGRVAIWQGKNPIVLSETPGAIHAEITDWNGDSRPDILVLFAQGDERIVCFENLGRLKFTEKTLKKFPPSYGSSHFTLFDANADNRLDIAYTAGDNADHSIIIKPYHGLYVFENQKNNTLKQIYFYPINGAYRVTAGDFDADGDTDLATIAFFDDVQVQPQENFMYFERTTTWQPRFLNIGEAGRWLTMDTADADGDGDLDIALGSHPISPAVHGLRKSWTNAPGVLLLKNKTR